MNFKQNGGIAEFEYLQRSRNLQVYGNKQQAYNYFIVELNLHILKFMNDYKIVILHIPCQINFMWQELYSSTIRNTIKVEAKPVE